MLSRWIIPFLVCLIVVGCGVFQDKIRIKTYTSDRDVVDRATFYFPEIDNRIDALMQKYSIPAVTIAIVRNDSLVYINCYGEQDMEQHIPVKNSTLFRIASISKPITVVALLNLMEEGRLSMDDRVFGEEGILGEDYGLLPLNSDWRKITVRHLIEHKSGIQNIPNDPMFSYEGLTNNEIIELIIRERPLSTIPGHQYYYSNIGYNVLGRIIERISGLNYEEYVKEKVLTPCGITRMRLATNSLEERFENEVIYVQPDEADLVYNMDVQRMDAHGGWVASSVDLARFISHVNRVDLVPDIIDEFWLEQTYLGFERWAHTGSLPGTATMLVRMNDEFSYVFLANHRLMDEEFWRDISSCMEMSINERNTWAQVDLFEKIKW